MSLKRRFVHEVQESALKDFIFMTDPKRWKELFVSAEEEKEDEVPMTDADIPDILDFIKGLKDAKSVNAGSIPVQGPEDGWV